MKPKSRRPAMLTTFLSLWGHLKPKRRRQLRLVAIPAFAAAFAEMISVGAIIPFLGVISSPETLFRLDAAIWISDKLDLQTPEELRFPLTVLFCGTIAFASALRLLVLWINSRLAHAITHDISVEVYRRSLYQPYEVQVARNSSKLLGGIMKARTVTVTFNTLLQMATGTCIGIFIVTALLLINPLIALVSFVGFGVVYGVTTMFTQGKLNRNGRVIAETQTTRFRAMQDGLGGIRDVILDGNQPLYTRLFRNIDLPFTQAQASTVFLANSPRYIIEPIAVVLIVTVAYVLSAAPGGFSEMVPTLGALALGAQRLLPVLQQGYSGWATLKSNHASLADVVEFLDQDVSSEFDVKRPMPLVLRHEISFRDVWFRYHEAGPDVLRGVTFAVPRGCRIGFLGATGSGKSTLFDLLMGLLTPTRGEILVDGCPVSGAGRLAWQAAIAHVPQSIYLADATFAENIAFGVPLAEIDMDRVHAAAAQAQIADFIESRKASYLSEVGERGVRISGGQRQRIGIARALYKKADVLIFDEATSALDNETERSVIEAIEGLGREFTICMIAHRLTTLKNCDLIVELYQGTIRATGSYENLVESVASVR